MPLAQFPAYRQYEQMRRSVNDSVMGLFAGAGLASLLLHPMVNAAVPLSLIYPNVEEISRFDLSIEKARAILDDAGPHIANMALPYLMSLHEDYMGSCLTLLAKDQLISDRAASRPVVSKMHEDFEGAIGSPLPSDSLQQFHVLREMRNCLIHRSGVIDDRLVAAASTCSKGALAGWRNVAKNSPQALKTGGSLKVGTGELVLGFAVSKLLARAVNELLVRELTRDTWIDIILEDMHEFGPGIPANAHERTRKITGYARHNYLAVHATPEELQEGLARMVY
ncbi:hypothetical protein OHA33_27195 [Streptomyces sp. NBC_00562]|uniref:hypothetical protein n=1 Tax=Streptomyces sp. NBC_00562 TaxID=2975777 RepID=UPI002E81546A|nr:hypothetical protein [Streptomyces sp. NBC_00562]WUC22256.1 hypothetical protein OHA33_27195 [Streptomyces sp. NBC_00562]